MTNSATSTVNAKAFYEAMKHLESLIHRNKLHILDEICVRFREDGCTLLATDIYNEISVDVPARGDNFDFAFCGTARVIRACRFFEGELKLELHGEGKKMRLALFNGGKCAEFPVTGADDYTILRPFAVKQSYETKAAVLLERMKRVKYASSDHPKNTRPETEGFQFYGTQLFCIDGCRMAVSEDGSLDVTEPFVVSKAAMTCLQEMGKATVKIDVGDRLIRFQAGSITALVKRIQAPISGKPDKYLPDPLKEHYTVDRKSYLKELNYLKQCHGPRGTAVATFKAGELTVYQQGAKYRAKVDVDGKCEIVYGMDVNFMLDALNQFPEAAYVEIRATSPYSPIIVTAEGTSDYALVMPHKMENAA